MSKRVNREPQPTFKLNVVFAYIDQFYMLAAGFALAPIFISELGVWSYGLFGLFATAQAFLQLLDVGIAPTMTRQAAVYAGGGSSALNFRAEFWIAERIFIVVGCSFLVIGMALLLFDRFPWTVTADGDESTIKKCLLLIVLAVTARFNTTLYKGVLRGLDAHSLIAVIGIASTSIRFIGAIPLIYRSEGDPSLFFLLQFVVFSAEAVACRLFLRKRLPQVNVAISDGVDAFTRLKAFTGLVTLASIAWIFNSSIDRAILSTVLSLSSFGEYTIAMSMVGLVGLTFAPINAIVGARLSSIVAAEGSNSAIEIYSKFSREVIAASTIVCSYLAFFSTDLIRIWIGDDAIATRAGPIVFYYSIGAMLAAISGCNWLLQFSRGRIRSHVIIAVSQCIVLPPILYFASRSAGAVGAAESWMYVQIAYFMFSMTVFHRDIHAGFHRSWLVRDFAPRLLISFSWAYSVSQLSFYLGVSDPFIMLSMLGLSLIPLSLFVSALARRELARLLPR